MKILTNCYTRRLGVPGRPALILDPGKGVEVTQQQLDEMENNRITSRWLEKGVLKVSDEPIKQVEGGENPPRAVAPKRPAMSKADRDEREEIELPDGVSGDGVEIHHSGGGWYEVYVNGFPVTDSKVRKDKAEEIAADYES